MGAETLAAVEQGEDSMVAPRFDQFFLREVAVGGNVILAIYFQNT